MRPLSGALGLVSATALLPACTPAARPETRPSPSSHSAPQPVSAAAPSSESSCAAWSTYQDGPYKYENNVWGSKKAKAAFEQCLMRRKVGSGFEYGWRWNWPGYDNTVFAYPQILFGWKPWSGGTPTDARFPLRVGDVQHLSIHYDVETEASGSYNLAPEVWIIEGSGASADPDPKRITTEVMFWMDYVEGAIPAGTVIDTPTLDGVTYELYKQDSIGDKGDGTGWALLSFKSPKVQHRGTISVHTLLDHLVRKGLVRPDEYVASVEFGNEVMGGSGTTWVKRFEVEVRP